MPIDDYEDPKQAVDGIANNIFHLCANVESRTQKGEELPLEEVQAIVERLKDYAADLQVAAARI
ncbi:hypothetical protein [Lentisalinibacter orientalis]|uniref:hypothetical protein n=1 Tax=Lentisalinibacter orientalis TaxID=2992241 RepID=UPI003863E081